MSSMIDIPSASDVSQEVEVAGASVEEVLASLKGLESAELFKVMKQALVEAEKLLKAQAGADAEDIGLGPSVGTARAAAAPSTPVSTGKSTGMFSSLKNKMSDAVKSPRAGEREEDAGDESDGADDAAVEIEVCGVHVHYLCAVVSSSGYCCV